MNELGFDAVSSGKAPILVIVASSTGDGDAPDNSAKFYAALKCVLALLITIVRVTTDFANAAPRLTHRISFRIVAIYSAPGCRS